MTFDDKRALLHWLFDGKNQSGATYGIYINAKGKGKEQKIDYLMYGRLTRLRTLKGDDINYMGDVDEELRKEMGNNYKTNIITYRIKF